MSLIRKLSEAETGSRELDEEIAKTIGLEVHSPGWLVTTSAMQDFPALAPIEPYTSSLDSAMTLVPKGWHTVSLRYSLNPAPTRQYCHAELQRDADSMDRDMEDWEPFEIEAQNAYTPALALCIAALRARSNSNI